MKANEVPEKIYIFEQDFQRKDHKVMYGVNQDKDIKGLIEYIRTDAFIEKADEYLQKHLIDYWLQGVTDESNFIEDFRKYMEGE